jgi:hypothetical protein
MRLVIIESPFAGDIARNIAYASACMRHCLSLGEAPFASHLLYTQALNDQIVRERAKGIAAGLAWARRADATIVYDDFGISDGMRLGIEDAKRCGRPIEYCRLPSELMGFHWVRVEGAK